MAMALKTALLKVGMPNIAKLNKICGQLADENYHFPFSQRLLPIRFPIFPAF